MAADPTDILFAFIDVRSKAPDHLGGTRALPAIDEWFGSSVPLAVIGWRPLSALAQLRLVEAGASFYLDRAELSFQPGWLLDLLDGREPIPRLPTRWELRESLGMRWDGAVEPLISALAALPETMWGQRPKLRSSQLTRRQVLRLRRSAAVAGFPSPDATRYSTTHRKAPAEPEWVKVWEVGRELLGWPAPEP